MTLVKTSFLTGLSTLVRVITAFFINKVIAIYIGPSGLALAGQLQNFTGILTTFSNGAINSGIVKYTAEYQDIEQKKKIFSTSIVISFFCSIVISIFLITFNKKLSVYILKSTQYNSVFIVFGLTIFLFALNTILVSILNGQKDIKKFISVNIASSIISLILTSFLVTQMHLMGALYTIVVNQSIVFFVTLLFVIKSSWFRVSYFLQGLDKASLIKLSKYSIMAVTSTLTIPVSHMFIRNYIGQRLGWDAAGYWQGVWKISEIYLMLVTNSLGVYYLPRLSEITDNNELKREIKYGYKIIMPIVIFMSLSIFLLRKYVILIAFNEEFMPMMELFIWQLIGDILKIASWLLAFLMIAKAMARTYIITEIIFSAQFILLSLLCINTFGLIGITYAYSINYLIYLFMMIFLYKRKFNV